MKISGYEILSQFKVGENYFLICDLDCSFEEYTFCYLLSPKWKVLWKKQFGFLFNWRLLIKRELIEGEKLRLEFLGAGIYEISFSTPGFLNSGVRVKRILS